jgi:WD40 repeat protein
MCIRNGISIAAMILLAPGIVRGDEKDQPGPMAVFQQKGSGGFRGLQPIAGGRLVALGSDDGVIRLWDPVKQIVEAELKGTGAILHLAADPKGKWLAARYMLEDPIDGEVLVWDLDKKTKTRLDVEKNSAIFPFAGTDGDSLFLCKRYGRGDKSLHVWSVSHGREARKLEGHRAPPQSAAMMADGSRIVSAGLDGEIIVWDAASGRVLHRMSVIDFGSNASVLLWSIAFLGQTSLFATTNASYDKVIIWDAKDGSKKKTLDLDDRGLPLSVSPPGKRLAVGHQGSVSIWDVESGKRLRDFIAQRDIVWVAYTADGKLLITSSFPDYGDGQVKAWELK